MITPRPYLSWSSLDLFERNPERWIEVYLYGDKNPVNREMVFGRMMAEGMEDGELTGNPVLDLTMGHLPKFEIMDKVIEDARGKEVPYFDPRTKKEIIIKIPVLQLKKKRNSNSRQARYNDC